MKLFMEMNLDSDKGRRVLLNAHCIQQVIEEENGTLKIVMTDGSTRRAGCSFDNFMDKLKEAVK